MKIRSKILKHLVYLRSVIWQFYSDKIYLSVVLAFFLALIIYILNTFFYPSEFWLNFTMQKGADIWFCEFTDLKKLIRQPINSFTNFWYLVNGIFFLSKGIGDYKRKKYFNLITANPFYSIALAVISFYTFSASFFYHSSLLIVAHHLDYSAVYSITLFPLMYFLHRIILLFRNKPTYIKHPTETYSMVISFTIIYLLITFFLPDAYTHAVILFLIALVFSCGFYLEKKQPNRTNKGFMYASITLIFVALVFFKLDPMKIGCDPDSFFQFHSMWHILNALAVFYLYLYFRSENYVPDKDHKLLPFRKKYLDF